MLPFDNKNEASSLVDVVEVPPFDDLLLYSLERRHLDVSALPKMLSLESKDDDINPYLTENVRLFKLDEIAFDSDEKLHLSGIESVLSSMRGYNNSLLFVVQGDENSTSVYLGICRFAQNSNNEKLNAVAVNYQKIWRANFPGSKAGELLEVESENKDQVTVQTIAGRIKECTRIGALTGIPSLKREEETQIFVQGLERFIRAMRGERYCWISIADPIPPDDIRNAISTCQLMESEVHRLVKINLSKAKSKGKTVTLGLFGMGGKGDSEGGAQNYLEDYQRAGSGVSAAGTIIGGAIGTWLIPIPGLGTVVGAAIGKTIGGAVGGLVNQVGAAITGKSGYVRSWAHTTQQALGGFGSIGLTLQRTTTVGQEMLNRKAAYAEEVLQAYEKRLHEGLALGMWNLGHYFCAEAEEAYQQGIGVINSLFAGMDSTYEPPRAIEMPEDFKYTLRRFQNVYLRFSDQPVSQSDQSVSQREKYDCVGKAEFSDHPFGFRFNGPATPVNTRELAIATPIATQDVEGVSVSRRPSFGINLGTDLGAAKGTLTLGEILDKGNSTKQSYCLSQKNLTKHLAVFGLTGSGKTNTVHHLLEQLWENGIPFLVIEPAKAEYRALAAMDKFKNDLLVISAGIERTDACPLRLNPFDFESGEDKDANRIHILTHIDRLKATFNASFPMYASMPYILEEAILEVYRERGWVLGQSSNHFVDIYRKDFGDYIPTLRDLYWKVSETVRRKGYFKEQQMNIEAALKARLSSLLVGSKGSMFDTPRSFPAKDLFERPVVVELENMGDDDEKAFLMGLLVSRLYEYRKATFKNDSKDPNKLQHVLVVEEAHRLLANIPDTSANQELGNPRGKAVASFVDMLSEIRAYGEGVVVVDQLPSRVSPNIVKGTGAKIVHRLLAIDDRESVGGTMGLKDEQIADLSLLRVGECVVSQDGDLKAFQVKVEKCKEHENRNGGEISEATKKYREEHKAIFETPPDDIDLEDGMFKDSLYKAMLAIGIGESPLLLRRIRPMRPVGAWPKRAADWYKVYWKQICSEIWNVHGGNWNSLVGLRKAGETLLTDVKLDFNALPGYCEAFKDYFSSSRYYAESLPGKMAGVAFGPFIVNGDLIGRKKSILEIINDNIGRVDGLKQADKYERLAGAIKRVLPFLEPRTRVDGIKFSDEIHMQLAEAIIERIAYALWDKMKCVFEKKGVE